MDNLIRFDGFIDIKNTDDIVSDLRSIIDSSQKQAY